jgi:glycosyltransferase involved in cell wall biosynthesis
VTAPDYVVLGTAPWEAPWLIEQNLAHALAARGRRVLYVEPPLSPATPFRYGLRRRTLADLRALLLRRTRTHAGVRVVRPLALPPLEHPRARTLSRPLVRRQIARASRRAGLESPALIALRALADVRGAVAERTAIYIVGDLLEAGAELLGKPVEQIRAELEADCAAADLVLCSSETLEEALAARRIASRVFRHGFHADLTDRYESPPPPEYGELGDPILAYAGRIDGRLDFGVLIELSERFGGGSVVLIGPRSERHRDAAFDRFAARPNVRLLGPFPRDQLPPYLAHASCLLLPYRGGEWARHGSPLKVWDYLYAGPPIAGSGYVELRRHPPPLVHFAERPDAFADTVAAALAEGAAGRAERRRFALANTWAHRAEELEAIIEELGYQSV